MPRALTQPVPRQYANPVRLSAHREAMLIRRFNFVTIQAAQPPRRAQSPGFRFIQMTKWFGSERPIAGVPCRTSPPRRNSPARSPLRIDHSLDYLRPDSCFGQVWIYLPPYRLGQSARLAVPSGRFILRVQELLGQNQSAYIFLKRPRRIAQNNLVIPSLTISSRLPQWPCPCRCWSHKRSRTFGHIIRVRWNAQGFVNCGEDINERVPGFSTATIGCSSAVLPKTKPFLTPACQT